MWYIYIIRSLVKHNISTYILHIPINKYCTCSSWIAGIPWPEDSCYHKGHLGIFALTTWRIIRLSNWLVTKVITNLWEDLPRIESEYLPLIVSAMILLKYEYHNFGVSENRAQICPNHPSHEWRILVFQPIISDLGIPHLKKPPNTSNMQFFIDIIPFWNDSPIQRSTPTPAPLVAHQNWTRSASRGWRTSETSNHNLSWELMMPFMAG